MRGAVAAGHRLTAEAGAQVLAEGGNAVDACIAAAFVSWVAESPLTGPGAGGFMLVHRAADGSTRLLDHFVTVPGLGLRRPGSAEMESVAVAFTPESSQTFRIGGASCAVPGAVAGLSEAHRQFGALPWRVLLEPAIELARAGVVLSQPQAYLHAILDLILRHTDEGQQIYGLGLAGPPGSAEAMAQLVEIMREQEVARGGPFSRQLYRGGLARRLYDERSLLATAQRLGRRLPTAERGTTHIA